MYFILFFNICILRVSRIFGNLILKIGKEDYEVFRGR